MKSTRDLIAECDSQLKVLYGSLGKHLYENIENGRIYFEFQKKDEQLAQKAGELLDRIRCMDEAVDANDRGLCHDSHDVVIARPNEIRPKQSPPVVEISSSLTSFASRKDKEQSGGTADQRGSLERYAEFMIELFEIKKKLISLKKDIEEYLSLTTLHLWDSASIGGTDAAVRSLRAIEEEIIFLIRNNMEAVQDLMARKKESVKTDGKGAYSDPAVLSAEVEFFNRVSADIRSTSRQVETLVKNAVTLFEEIKHIYKESVAVDRHLERDFGSREDSGIPSGYDAAEAAMEDMSAPEESLLTAGAAEEIPEDSQDEDLLEAAARRLSQKNVGADEKLQILSTVLRSVPDRAVVFMLGLLRDMDTTIKKQLVDILIMMDNPILVDIYREFLTSEDTLLRMHGIMGLKRIGSEDAKDAIVSAVEDRDANVRRLVANCLDSLATHSEMSAVMRLANDADETVARVAIRKLGMMKSRVSFTQVLPKLDSPNEKIRKEAIDALRAMTGTDLGYRYLASGADRKKSVQSWQKFWSENQSNPHFLEEMRLASKTKTVAPAKKPGAVRAKADSRSKSR